MRTDSSFTMGYMFYPRLSLRRTQTTCQDDVSSESNPYKNKENHQEEGSSHHTDQSMDVNPTIVSIKAFMNHLRRAQWPRDFDLVKFEAYIGNTNSNEQLEIYHLSHQLGVDPLPWLIISLGALALFQEDGYQNYQQIKLLGRTVLLVNQSFQILEQ